MYHEMKEQRMTTVNGKAKLQLHIDPKIANRFKAACKKSRYPMSKLLEVWAEEYAEKIEAKPEEDLRRKRD